MANSSRFSLNTPDAASYKYTSKWRDGTLALVVLVQVSFYGLIARR